MTFLKRKIRALSVFASNPKVSPVTAAAASSEIEDEDWVSVGQDAQVLRAFYSRMVEYDKAAGGQNPYYNDIITLLFVLSELEHIGQYQRDDLAPDYFALYNKCKECLSKIGSDNKRIAELLKEVISFCESKFYIPQNRSAFVPGSESSLRALGNISYPHIIPIASRDSPQYQSNREIFVGVQPFNKFYISRWEFKNPSQVSSAYSSMPQMVEDGRVKCDDMEEVQSERKELFQVLPRTQRIETLLFNYVQAVTEGHSFEKRYLPPLVPIDANFEIVGESLYYGFADELSKLPPGFEFFTNFVFRYREDSGDFTDKTWYFYKRTMQPGEIPLRSTLCSAVDGRIVKLLHGFIFDDPRPLFVRRADAR